MPAIALTAAAGTRGRELSLHAGFQEYLEKPIDISRLTRALVEVAQQRQRS